MTWQDFTIFVSQAALAVALVPALVGSEKPPRSTCWATALPLLACAAAYLSLGLRWSFASASLCGIMWLWLALQRRLP